MPLLRIELSYTSIYGSIYKNYHFIKLTFALYGQVHTLETWVPLLSPYPHSLKHIQLNNPLLMANMNPPSQFAPLYLYLLLSMGLAWPSYPHKPSPQARPPPRQSCSQLGCISILRIRAPRSLNSSNSVFLLTQAKALSFSFISHIVLSQQDLSAPLTKAKRGARCSGTCLWPQHLGGPCRRTKCSRLALSK